MAFVATTGIAVNRLLPYRERSPTVNEKENLSTVTTCFSASAIATNKLATAASR